MSFRRLLSLSVVLAFALCSSSLLSAQSKDGVAKYELFGGYSWYHPGGQLPAYLVIDQPTDRARAAAAGTAVPASDIPNFNGGWGAQFTYNLNHWAGIAVDVAGHYSSDYPGKAHSFTAGPQFKLRKERFTPFGEILLGAQYDSPKVAPNQTAFAFIAGGGVDVPVTPRFSVRVAQVDYVYSYYNKLVSTTIDLNGVRVQAGLVYNFGIPVQNVPTAACSVAPAAVDAGAPVRVSVTPGGFLPKRTLNYAYTSTGGKVSGTGMTSSVDTTGLAPGSYTVSAKVMDNGKGKHQQMASCTASFSVNKPPMHPPVLSVSANPPTVKAGDASTITAVGSSPDNRPLTYNCTPNAGRLTGSGPVFTLETAGVPAGAVTVSCTVSDDRNLTASASTSVNVVVPAVPQASKFGTIGFNHDKKRPTRVDNEAKAELDRYADALTAAPDAKGVVVGYATAKEDVAKKGSKMAPEFAAKRAVNTKEYLTKEKGIDPARIEARSAEGEQTTDLWIVPAGATFPAAGTMSVDEAKVKAVPRTAPKPKKMRKKAVAPATAKAAAPAPAKAAAPAPAAAPKNK